MKNTVSHSDCTAYLRTLPDSSVDSCVTDPPYELGFMGKKWDASGIAYSVELWREVLRVLKPGAYLLAFGGTRTHHRMVCAIEDAGFEIRDEMQWLYGSGFPKSLDIGKAIDKAAGAEREKKRIPASAVGNIKARSDSRPFIEAAKVNGYHEMDGDAPATAEAKQWDGWGTALKPACEPICVARKPLDGTVAANVIKHGTGGINVAACRIAAADGVPKFTHRAEPSENCYGDGKNGSNRTGEMDTKTGRWPANVLLTHAPGCVCTGTKRVKGTVQGVKRGNANFAGAERADIDRDAGYADADGLETVESWQCQEGCPVKLLDEQSGELTSGLLQAGTKPIGKRNTFGNDASAGYTVQRDFGGDTGGASRFFYTAKASRSEREHFNNHATVKPLALMRYLVRLVTPPDGTVLDMFAGSGTTLVAARQEGFQFLGCDADEGHVRIATGRLALELPFEKNI